jgi:hypothetical protein
MKRSSFVVVLYSLFLRLAHAQIYGIKKQEVDRRNDAGSGLVSGLILD